MIGQTVPTSPVARWTSAFLAVVFLAVVAIVGGNRAGLTSLWAYVGLLAMIGLGVGLLTGSPQMRPSGRGATGFAVGSTGAVCASIISLVIVLAFETERVEVIPALVALVAGLFGTVAGAACAIGALVGGFLRGRLSREVALA